MKSNYEEKKEARLESYQRLAAKNDQLSDSAYKASHDIVSCIPPGQPILVGHHSEKRHRKALERSDNAMRKSVEADKKAAYYRDRAESLMSNTAISSDNPDALDLLQEKLEKLQARQELMRMANKIVRSAKLSQVEKVIQLQELGFKESSAVKILEMDHYGTKGYPQYVLSNNNGVIANTKKRIQHLESIAKLHTEEVAYPGGVTLKLNVEDNRVQIFFPGKPSEEIRNDLKRAGFHYSYTVGAWMRLISNWAIHEAKEIIKKHYPS